jgi:hypothetical protein
MNYLINFAQILDDKAFPKNGTSTNDAVQIFNVVYAIFGVIAVIAVIYAGIQLIISLGNSEKVATARRNVIYALAGLVITISAGAIVSYVINALTK